MGWFPVALVGFGGVPFAGNVFKCVDYTLLLLSCLLLLVCFRIDALR